MIMLRDDVFKIILAAILLRCCHAAQPLCSTTGSSTDSELCSPHAISRGCAEEVLHAYSEKLRPQWPATVDLVCQFNIKHGYLAHIMLRSIELFWPKGIGKVIVILDSGEEHLATMLPPWVTTIFKEPESELDSMPGYLVKEFWNLWADNYTTADYVAFMDTDAPFITLITPDLLFRGNKLIVVGGSAHDFVGPDEFLLGEEGHIGNFMFTLPWVVPRQIFPAMRAHIESVHHDQVINVLAEAVRQYYVISTWSTQGNFLWFHMNESIHWSIQGLAYHDEETLRPTCHLTYSDAFKKTAAYKDMNPAPADDKHVAKHSVAFYSVAARELLHGVCDSFPEGKVDGCGGISEGKQPELREWEGVSRGDGFWDNTVEEQDAIYHRHFGPVWAMYDDVVKDTCGNPRSSNHPWKS